MKYEHAVVVAVGRSGTRYASVLLSGQGIQCTHQKAFTAERPGTTEVMRQRADSSALAAPFVMEIPDNWLIVHQVRDPLLVVDSLIRLQHLPSQHLSPGTKFYKKYVPDASCYAPGKDEALCIWVDWNRMILKAKGRPNYRFHRIEDGLSPWKKIVEDLGASWDPLRAQAVSKTEGTAGVPRSIKWKEFTSSVLRTQAMTMAAQFGYEVPECTL